MDILYTLNLTITRPVCLYNTDDTLQETADWMLSAEAKREIEKEVLQALRKLDGDCDVEVMSTSTDGTLEEANDEPPATLTRTERLQGLADRGCDTWEEYRGER